MRGLRSLGIGSDQYGSLLIPVIMSKMPPDIRLRIARETKSEVWKIDELLEVIKVEVEAREASEGTKVNPHTKPLHLLGHKNSSGQLPATHPTTGSFFSNNKSIQCVYCQGNHYSASCEKVETIDERRDILIKTGRCFNCLKSNHKSKDCNNPRTCRTCHRRHHQSICPQQKPAKEQLEPEPKLDNSTISNAANSMKDKNYVLLQTAQAVALNDTNNKSTMIRVLFDSGSQRTYITESLKTKLNLKPISRERLHLNTFGNPSFSTRLCDVVQLCLKKPGSDVLITITALCFPVICSSLPDICSVANCQHLEGLELADVVSGGRNVIDVLVGSDFYWSIVTGEVKQGDRGPTAVSSKLGWLLSGPVDRSMTEFSTSYSAITHVSDDFDHKNSDHIVSTLKKFWETDSIGIVDSQNSEPPIDTPFVEQILFVDGQYEVSLPWKEEFLEVSNHYQLSLNRLRHLQRRCLKSPEIMSEYNRIIQEQLVKGIVEEVPEYTTTNDQSVTKVHYLPHHAVIRRERQTTKLRIVYDGSAREGDETHSLNDILKTGPNYIPMLFNTLLKFRTHPVAIVADIEKAFLMVGISSSDRDVLRFLWFKDPFDINSEIIHLHFTRLVFGLRPSPAILGAVISHHLDKYRNEHPQLVSSIRESLYVDDLVSGANTVEEAFEYYLQAKKIMSEAGMNLRKWNSNSAELCCKIQKSESRSHDQNTVSPSSAVSEEEESFVKSETTLPTPTDGAFLNKLLGLGWDCETDQFVFNLQELIDYSASLPSSKRSILKVTSKIFDPLGLLSPFVIRLKVLFQTLCKEGSHWDDPLQEEYLRIWKLLLSEFRALNNLRIPRCYFSTDKTPVSVQLHGFCDASYQAYAAVVYIRSVLSDGSVDTQIVSSKTRVAPIKQQSIPRLELLGALILSRLSHSVISSLPSHVETFYWTDSMTVIYWIQNSKPWKQYVSHRVNEVHQLTNRNHWRHCPGVLNPADLPSRRITGKELTSSSMWWNGPAFLQLDEEKWPLSDKYSDMDEAAQAELMKSINIYFSHPHQP